MDTTPDNLHEMIDNFENVQFKKFKMEKTLDLFIDDARKLNDENLELIHSIIKEFLSCYNKKTELLIKIVNTLSKKNPKDLEKLLIYLKNMY